MTRVTSTYITAVIHTNYEQQKKRETKSTTTTTTTKIKRVSKSPFIAPA